MPNVTSKPRHLPVRTAVLTAAARCISCLGARDRRSHPICTKCADRDSGAGS